MKDAEENDSLYELKAIIRLCNSLPFDSNSIKVAEIGKLIKKLQKYQPRSPNNYPMNDVNEFLQDVNKLVDYWKEQLAAISKNKQQTSGSLPLTPTSIQQQKTSVQVKNEAIQKAKEASNREKKVSLSNVAASVAAMKTAQSQNEAKFMRDDSQELTEPMDVDEEPTTSKPTKSYKEQYDESVEEETKQPTATATQAPSTVPTTRERKPLDMVEGARKLLAMRSQQIKAASEANKNLDLTNNDQLNEEGEKKVYGKELKPLGKGGLKKKDKNREKFSVKWADENGGLLRDIQTIEVEKIKSSVANYKSHKDLVKKERQFEKETHLLKTTEAMQRTTEWRA
jgi:hypothetical protein